MTPSRSNAGTKAVRGAVKRIAILGSTGSIGISALDVIASLGGDFRVVALSADSNIKLLTKQARLYRPRVVCLGDERLADEARTGLRGRVETVSGEEGLCRIVGRDDVDMVVVAISGSAALVPLVEAIRRKKEIALANKESIVVAGEYIMALARRHGVRIVPIDSEHSAIFQCLDGREAALSKIYLTGSGGPLLNVPAKRFDRLPRSVILNHPRWKMGRKISVDSATMMNKGLEVIEASRLFGVENDAIEVLVHPEAIIHSMVELVDGMVFAQLSIPNMRIPIQYALTYPRRAASAITRVNFPLLGAMTFLSPDAKRFPCLGLAREALAIGATMPAVLNAADEVAVARYLEGKIRFNDIPRIIQKVMRRHSVEHSTGADLNEILKTEVWAREEARIV